MKSKLLKCLLIPTCLFTLTVGNLVTVTATPLAPAAVEATADEAASTITPRRDVIVTLFRVYYGQRQMRRWNETRGYWVDPAWINLP